MSTLGIRQYFVPMLGDNGSTPSLGNNFNAYYTDTGMSGALPSTFGTVAGLTQGPTYALRVA